MSGLGDAHPGTLLDLHHLAGEHGSPAHRGRTALERLLKNAHTEPYAGAEIDLSSWRTFAATLGDHRLTMAGLSPDLWAIGHTTTTTAVVIQQDGTILADAPDSPSLTALRSWLKQWEAAGRPALATYTPALVPTSDGWDLRLSGSLAAAAHAYGPGS